MPDFPGGTSSTFARAVSAEVRAAMSARRVTLREVAKAAGFGSHNYLAVRLRDEKPFTLDDIDLICIWLEEDPPVFLGRAWENHWERISYEAENASRERRVPDVDDRPSDGPKGKSLAERRAEVERLRAEHEQRVAEIKASRPERARRYEVHFGHLGDDESVARDDADFEAHLDGEIEYDDEADLPQALPLRRGMPGGAAPLADAARKTSEEPGLRKARREHDEAAERIEDDRAGMEPS